MKKVKEFFGKRVYAILLGALFATNAWIWAVPTSFVWTKIWLGFCLGWSLVSVIQGLLLEQDIRNIDRDIDRMTSEIESINRQTAFVRSLNDARNRKSMSMYDLRPPGPMH